jgi:hypothetical protein
MLFAFTSKAGILPLFSLKAYFLMEKNDLGFPPPPQKNNHAFGRRGDVK